MRINRVNSFEYATVELIKADALVVVKGMDDLLGHNLDRCLNIGLVFRPSCPRWQRSGVVVLEKLLVRGVDTTIAIGSAYRVRCRRGVVRDDDLCHPAEVLKRLHMRVQPRLLAFIGTRTSKQHPGIR